jgi:hypothetical protein
MARRGISPSQLVPYWSPDVESYVDPTADPEVRDALERFCRDVWQACVNLEAGRLPNTVDPAAPP